MSQIDENFTHIKKRISNAAQIYGRMLDNIQLVAVSKIQPKDKILAALDTGHRVFGENRVQDAQLTWEDLKTKYPDIVLHLIGPLQTNKVKDAVALFDVIETVDRVSLADALAKEMNKQKKFLPCFIQVNTGEEPQKSGVMPANLPSLLSHCLAIKLNVMGLMCIPPEHEPSALHFAFLSKLAKRYGLKNLSMGMSGDFEKAIPLGATHVRVGIALFGARQNHEISH
jgi:PLP dependent protein